MGMIAVYQLISDEQLTALKKINTENDEIFKEIEEWGEDEELLIDIDKMWDTLHFVLTGADSGTRIADNPLSESIIGITPVCDADVYIAYTENSKIAKIIAALDSFDMEKALENFSMEECKKADLYPDIWDYEDEIDEIKEDLLVYFQNIKDFYKQVLAANGNVVVTIC